MAQGRHATSDSDQSSGDSNGHGSLSVPPPLSLPLCFVCGSVERLMSSVCHGCGRVFCMRCTGRFYTYCVLCQPHSTFNIEAWFSANRSYNYTLPGYPLRSCAICGLLSRVLSCSACHSDLCRACYDDYGDCFDICFCSMPHDPAVHTDQPMNTSNGPCQLCQMPSDARCVACLGQVCHNCFHAESGKCYPCGRFDSHHVWNDHRDPNAAGSADTTQTHDLRVYLAEQERQRRRRIDGPGTPNTTTPDTSNTCCISSDYIEYDHTTASLLFPSLQASRESDITVCTIPANSAEEKSVHFRDITPTLTEESEDDDYDG